MENLASKNPPVKRIHFFSVYSLIILLHLINMHACHKNSINVMHDFFKSMKVILSWKTPLFHKSMEVGCQKHPLFYMTSRHMVLGLSGWVPVIHGWLKKNIISWYGYQRYLALQLRNIELELNNSIAWSGVPFFSSTHLPMTSRHNYGSGAQWFGTGDLWMTETHSQARKLFSLTNKHVWSILPTWHSDWWKVLAMRRSLWVETLNGEQSTTPSHRLGAQYYTTVFGGVPVILDETTQMTPLEVVAGEYIWLKGGHTTQILRTSTFV